MAFTIACDVDDVVLPLIPAWLARYNADYDDTLTADDVTQWDISKCVHPSCGADIYRYLTDPTLYEAIRPYEGALESIEMIREAGHRVVFVTAANCYTMGRKYRWLQERGFLPAEPMSSRDYIEAHDKVLINAHLLIDDRAETVAEWVATGRPAIVVDRPHNRRAALSGIVPRATSWAEIVAFVAMLHDDASARQRDAARRAPGHVDPQIIDRVLEQARRELHAALDGTLQ